MLTPSADYLYPLLRRLYPNMGISAEDLDAGIVHAGLYRTGDKENPFWKILTFTPWRGYDTISEDPIYPVDPGIDLVCSNKGS